MYISKLELKNIRCFENETINFNSGRDGGKWAVVLGDNGLGKTTILQSIALSLCGKSSVSGLMDELYGELIRTNENEGSIRLELSSEHNGHPYWVETTFTRDKPTDMIEIVQNTYPKDFPWDDFFVCGYGACRGILGSNMGITEYSVTDAVYTLFNYEAKLLNPELMIRRIRDVDDSKADELTKKMLRKIDKILMFPEGSTALSKVGLSTNGFWGKSMPTVALGDGHKATMTWLVDMLGWILLYDETMFQNEISGIVLLDEIEQHLHPSWQKAIIKLINEQFPDVQFVITTHSPLCAIGTTDLSDDVCTLALLTEDEKGCSKVYDKLNPPRGLRADQVLTSYLFGLTTSGDNATINKIKRYSDLLSRKVRTESEEGELLKLRNELNNILGSEETELQQIVALAVQEVLEKNPESISFDKKAIDYEIKRRLEELFS